MVPTTYTEAESFQLFLSQEIANGGRHKSPEELVEQWRRDQQELQESVAAIREALDEMDRGVPGIPLEVVAKEMREKYDWTD